MKLFTFVTIIPALLLSSCQNNTEKAPPAGNKLPGVAARVNGVDISDAQVDTAFVGLLAERPEMRDSNPGGIATTRRNLADGLATERALLDQAKKLMIAPTDQEIESELQKARGSFMSEDAYKVYLTSHQLTDASFADIIRHNMTIERLIYREVIKKNPPSDQEVKDFFDKNKNLFLQPEKWRVSEISIPLDGDDQKAREQATTIQSRLRAGIPFEKLAQDFSASASKARGGDIGYIERGRSSATNEQIYNLQPGQITEPIRLPDGYRIYKCTEKIPTKQRTLDDTSVHQECQKRLRFQQIQQFIQAVKRDAKVEIY